MASFTPPDPPFEPGEPTPPPQLGVPYPPPLVGEGSPWAPADAENRDLILDWWRMWFLQVFFPWIASFIDYWSAQWDRLAAYINTWITAADEYITEHAIAGYSIRVTSTPIAATGTTDVTITEGLDAEHRPLTVGDIVLDQTDDSRFGAITVVIDSTHATVQVLGSVKGYPGHGWWITATAIAHAGTTDVVLTADASRVVQLGDLVVDESASSAYGIVTVVTDPTHVTVAYVNTLQGEQGPQGIQGDPGIVQAVVAGTGIAVDDTDPANPIVSATGAGTGVVVSVVAGAGIAVDDTDPANPIVSATGGGGGSTVFATQTALFAGPTTVGDTYTVANAPGLFWTPLGGTAWAIEGTLQVDTSDDTSSLFDTDFYTDYFDGSGRVLYVFHRYSGVTYRWTDANYAPGLPWDSDWIFAPPVSNIPEIGAGSVSGMLKFTAGLVNFRGEVVMASATTLGDPLEFQLPPGLVTDYTGDLPVQPIKIGDCWLTDGTSSWRGIVVASVSGIDASGYFLFIPDLASSTNFGSDIWAGDVTPTVNHTWASGAKLQWELSLPLDSFGTSYDDGRSAPGGDFPVGGGALGSPTGTDGRGLIYPTQNEPTETLTNPLPSQVGVTAWDFTFGLPIPPGIDTLGGSGVQGVGASFSASGIQGGYVGEYVPVMDQPVSFTGLATAGITGLTDDTVYYVNSITGGYFTVSATVGGSTVPFTGTGTCDTFTLHDLPAGTVVHKNSQYEYVFARPVLAAGYALFNVQQQQYWNWLLYAF